MRVARAAADLEQFLTSVGNPAAAKPPDDGLKIDQAARAGELASDQFHLVRVVAELGRGAQAFTLFRQAADGPDPLIAQPADAAPPRPLDL